MRIATRVDSCVNYEEKYIVIVFNRGEAIVTVPFDEVLGHAALFAAISSDLLDSLPHLSEAAASDYTARGYSFDRTIRGILEGDALDAYIKACDEALKENKDAN